MWLGIGLMANLGPDRYTWQQTGRMTEDSQYLSWEEMMNREPIYTLEIAEYEQRLYERPTRIAISDLRPITEDRSDCRRPHSTFELRKNNDKAS